MALACALLVASLYLLDFLNRRMGWNLPLNLGLSGDGAAHTQPIKPNPELANSQDADTGKSAPEVTEAPETVQPPPQPAIPAQPVEPPRAEPEPPTANPAPAPNVETSGKAFTIPDLSMEMLWVKPGTFEMGSPLGEKHRLDSETRHTVTLTQGFYLGKYEVTQAQWEKVMGSNPSHFKGVNRPVETVSWNSVRSFCDKLTELEREAGRLPAGMSYQLPTEAQWEYACRAGTTTAYAFGDSLTSGQTNIRGGPGGTTEVGKYPGNAWGFHDMHGNVHEWCAGPHVDYPRGAVTDPVGPADDGGRVFRGGSWEFGVESARSARRTGVFLAYSSNNLGFRLSLRPVSKAEPQVQPVAPSLVETKPPANQNPRLVEKIPADPIAEPQPPRPTVPPTVEIKPPTAQIPPTPVQATNLPEIDLEESIRATSDTKTNGVISKNPTIAGKPQDIFDGNYETYLSTPPLTGNDSFMGNVTLVFNSTYQVTGNDLNITYQITTETVRRVVEVLHRSQTGSFAWKVLGALPQGSQKQTARLKVSPNELIGGVRIYCGGRKGFREYLRIFEITAENWVEAEPRIKPVLPFVARAPVRREVTKTKDKEVDRPSIDVDESIKATSTAKINDVVLKKLVISGNPRDVFDGNDETYLSTPPLAGSNVHIGYVTLMFNSDYRVKGGELNVTYSVSEASGGRGFEVYHKDKTRTFKWKTLGSLPQGGNKQTASVKISPDEVIRGMRATYGGRSSFKQYLRVYEISTDGWLEAN